MAGKVTLATNNHDYHACICYIIPARKGDGRGAGLLLKCFARSCGAGIRCMRWQVRRRQRRVRAWQSLTCGE